MWGIFKLSYTNEVIVGTHDGYCSGAECEDYEENDISDTQLLFVENKHTPFLKYLISNIKIDSLSKLLSLQMYCYVDYYYLNHPVYAGSGYCSASPSGLQHEVSTTSTMVISLTFEKIIITTDIEIRKTYRSQISSDTIYNLKKQIYSLLFCLHSFSMNKDMRKLIVSYYLNLA
jgi:hypothetical protein